jgi:hypothetical protein
VPEEAKLIFMDKIPVADEVNENEDPDGAAEDAEHRYRPNEQGDKMEMCLQFNTIWNELSVDQSITFIGEVKGLSTEDI